MTKLIAYFDHDKATDRILESKPPGRHIRHILPENTGIRGISAEALKFAEKGKIVELDGGLIIRPADRKKGRTANEMVPHYLRPKIISTLAHFNYSASTNQIFVGAVGMRREGGFLQPGELLEDIPMEVMSHAVEGLLISYRGGLEIKPTDVSKEKAVNALMPVHLRPQNTPPEPHF